MKHLSREQLTLIRKDKLRKEIASAKRLLQSEVEPLKVADGFLHDVFKLMEEGVHRRYPNLNKKEINQKIEDTLTFIGKFKSRKKRGNNQ